MGISYVYFALSGNNFDPDIVTKKLGIIPTQVMKKGRPIGNSGKKLSFSSWEWRAEKIDNLFVNKLVEEVVNRLFEKIDLINELKKEFQLSSILEVVLYIDANEEISTPVIGHDLKTIEFLYKTNTETDVDIYRFNSRD